MIFDLTSPKGIVLIRVPSKGPRPELRLSPADYIPLEAAGEASPTTWRPDVTTAQNWQRNTVAAESPLPSGETVTYSLRKQPRVLTFTALLSDYTLLGGTIDTVRRSVDLLAGIQQWYADRALVAAIGPFDIIQTAYIAEMSNPRTPEDGSALTVNLTIRELRTYELVQLPSIDDLAGELGALRTRSGGVVIG